MLTTPNLAFLYNRLALLIGYAPFTNKPSLKFGLGHLREFEGGTGVVPGGKQHTRDDNEIILDTVAQTSFLLDCKDVW